GNAMLVSSSIYQACKFYELFIANNFDKCAIVTSYKPAPTDIKGEETGEGLTERLEQYEIYQKMLNGQDSAKFEEEAKRKFVEEPGQMKLLIVVDKLLTGFDAPSATYLYIDKQMRDHGLFQAICRVNRLDGDDKEYGYIVDYKDLFQSLKRSITDYTSEALDGYDKADVEGLLSERIAKARERLEDAREALRALCEPVAPPKGSDDYRRYFCGNTANKDALKEHEPQRVALYKLTASLIRAFANLANELPAAGYTPPEIEQLKREVSYYEKVRAEIKMASGDYIDLKVYEPAMRHLLDTYIRAEESEKISTFDDFTLIQLIVERGVDALQNLPAGIVKNKTAMAETIENNLRKVITDERPSNPMYYDKMSELLDTLIQARQTQAQDYEQYLAQIFAIARQVQRPESGVAYSTSLNTRGKRALYDNLGQNEQMAIDVDGLIRRTKKDGWRGNMIKEREIRNAIREVVPDETLADDILEIVKQQDEY
ncbi:MAG: type I restriction enzyme subunit R domain-containing protein, partial [Ktedonobacteraceae bacterium]